MSFRSAALRRLGARATWRPPSHHHPPWLWSKAFGRYCDFGGPDDYWRADTESRQSESFFRQHYGGAHGLVWLRLNTVSRAGVACDLDAFVRAALPTIRAPFALVTTDGDASVPSDLPKDTVERLLGCPWLVSWHTQNCDGYPHAKLAPIPIGLDLHTPRAWSSPERLLSKLSGIRDGRLPLDRAPLRVFCDLNVSQASETRREALTKLRHCDHVDFLESRQSQTGIWRRYARYPFVLSAEGNGLDSHRTWELLYLGCIVIIRKSSLDPLFEGLPVAMVDNWEEVRDQANLAMWLSQYGDLTDQEYIRTRLDPRRYIDPIRAKLAAAS